MPFDLLCLLVLFTDMCMVHWCFEYVCPEGIGALEHVTSFECLQQMNISTFNLNENG